MKMKPDWRTSVWRRSVRRAASNVATKHTVTLRHRPTDIYPHAITHTYHAVPHHHPSPPYNPTACTSSKNVNAPYSAATSHISAMGAISPSME